ncbi:MAG: branched-chain amino acid ABC transporter permease [Burkholderiaceae bacterium]|nr:branched-chain amino acid ABC transporter permease [Burkholderiaceae bacterium]
MKKTRLGTASTTLAEVVFWLALASCYFFLPQKLPLLTQMLIVGLFAVSLDLALGYAGILTVGHAAFFGAGAYTAGWLAVHGWAEPFSGVLAALVVCAVLGYLLSWLVVRGADLTRLMITIAVCVLLGELAVQYSGITGGSDGLHGIEMADVLGRFEFDLYGRTGFVYAYGVVLVAFLVTRRIVQSPFGVSLRGIHQNRVRMQALGAPVDRRLRMAYCISAAIAGVAGALLAQTTQFVGIESLSFHRSAEVLIILVLGGTGRLYGGLIGAIAYMTVHSWLADASPEYWMLGLGVLLIVVALFGRGGLMGLLR